MYNEEPCQTADFSTSVPGCVCANNLYFEVCAFQVIKSPHSCQDHCYRSRLCVRRLQKLVEASEDGQIQAPVAQEHGVLPRPGLSQMNCLCRPETNSLPPAN